MRKKLKVLKFGDLKIIPQRFYGKVGCFSILVVGTPLDSYSLDTQEERKSRRLFAANEEPIGREG